MHSYNIYGLSRSGNHAIIFWFIHNLVEKIDHIGNEIYIGESNKICYINNVEMPPSQKKLKQNFPTDHFEYVIKSYEDKFIQQNTNIIILRDFLNLLCSRYKKYHKHKHNICLDNNYICDIHYLIDVWKQHAQAKKRIVSYNEWVESKEYRDKISLDKFGIDNTKDNINYISPIGQGSSFGLEYQSKNHNNRYDLINLPNHIKKIILKDKDLQKMNQDIFNISIKSILNNNYEK